MEDDCKIFWHFEFVSQGVLDEEGTGTGTLIGGKIALENINTGKGKE